MTIKWVSGKKIEYSTGDTLPTIGVEEGTEAKNITTGLESTFIGGIWTTDPGGASNLDDLTDVDLVTDAPDNNDVLTYSSSGAKWVPAPPPGAGGGEVNTVTNVGTGEGTLAKAKVGVDIPLKSLKQGTNVTLTNNTNDVTITSDIPDGSTTVKGKVELATDGENAANVVVQGNDSRLSNARIPTFPTSFTYTVYDESGTVKARNNKTNTIQYSDVNLDVVLHSIIESSGDPSVEVQSGTYNLSSGLTKIIVPSYSEIKMQRGTKIKVPQDYADCIFFLTANTQYSTIEGGEYSELGTPASNWYVVEMFPDMTPSEEGVLHNRIASINAYQAKAPIHLKTDTTSWINSNTFEDIFANRCKYLIHKEHVNAFTALASGMNVNTFLNCRMQAQGSTPQALGGVVGIDGDANGFINCSVWDLQAANASAKSLQITANARYTTVLGGYIASYNYEDLGKWTGFHDKYVGLSSHKLAVTGVEATGVGSNEILGTFKVRDDISNFFQIENGTVTDALYIPQFRYKQYTSNTFARIDVHDVATAFDTSTTPFYLIDFRKNNASAITSTTKPLLRLGNFATGEYDFYIDRLDMKNNSIVNLTLDADGTGNSITNIENADIKTGANIAVAKLAAGTDTHVLTTVSGVPTWSAPSGGGGAPTDAQYLTLATNGTLSAERVLTAGTNIAINDAGANGAATLNVPDSSTTVKGAVELATDGEVASNVVVQGNDARLVRDLYEEMKTRTQVGEVDIQDARWGSGMFTNQPTFIGNNTGWADDSDGLYRYYGTGTTSGTKAGNVTTSNIFRRQFKPHLYFIFKLHNSTTNHAMFIGLSSVNTAAETHATAPLANISGIGLVVLTSQANYQIAHNSGGATATLVNTGIAKGTTIKSCEIKNANNDSNWSWNLNNGEASGTITTNVPAETTDLHATWHNINASTTDHYLYLYKMIGKVTIL